MLLILISQGDFQPVQYLSYLIWQHIQYILVSGYNRLWCAGCMNIRPFWLFEWLCDSCTCNFKQEQSRWQMTDTFWRKYPTCARVCVFSLCLGVPGQQDPSSCGFSCWIISTEAWRQRYDITRRPDWGDCPHAPDRFMLNVVAVSQSPEDSD